MNSNNPLETSQKHEAEVAEHGNGHDTEKFISTAQHDEKGIHPLDSGGTSDDGSDFKFTFKLFLSLLAMAFLWVGSQIPLYLTGSVLAVIYTDIGGTDRWVWFVIGYLIPNAAITPFVGALSDLFGRRPVAVAGQLFLIVGPVVTSTANTMNICIAGSVIAGFGAGLNEMVALSGTAELVPAKLRGLYVAAIVFSILPFVAATLYAQLITAASSWRYVGIFVAGWNFIGLILVALVYKPPPRVFSEGHSKMDILRRVDYLGGLLSTGGVTCFMMGMQWGTTQYLWTSVHVLVPFFIGIALIIAFFVWEIKFAPYPMAPKRMFTKSKKTMIIILIITFLSGSNYFVLLLLWPTQNYNVYGYDPVGIGLRTLPIGIGILTGSFIALVLIPVTKGRIRIIMVCATALMTAGTGSMSASNTHNLNSMYGLVLIAGLGVGGVIIPCSIIAQLVCPDDLIGTITAITLAIRYVGGAVGFSVYDNVLFHKFVQSSTEIVAVDTIIGGGLVNYTGPADLILVTELTTLAGNAQFAQLKQILATDPRVIGQNAYELIVLATREAWSLAYRWPYWVSIAWGSVCLVLSFFLGDISQFLDNHVAVQT